MLGRYAYEVQTSRNAKEITTMQEVLSEGQKYKETLWEIMVSSKRDEAKEKRYSLFDDWKLTRLSLSLFCSFQVDMTPAGKRIAPGAGEQEMRLLDVKYKIFRESIDVQRRWRAMVDEAYGERQ